LFLRGKLIFIISYPTLLGEKQIWNEATTSDSHCHASACFSGNLVFNHYLRESRTTARSCFTYKLEDNLTHGMVLDVLFPDKDPNLFILNFFTPYDLCCEDTILTCFLIINIVFRIFLFLKCLNFPVNKLYIIRGTTIKKEVQIINLCSTFPIIWY
jgi:hypothetical protein